MGALRWDAERWQNSSPTAKFRRSFEAGHATRPQIAEHAGEPDGWLAPCPGIDPARRRPPRFGVRERQARASPDYAAAVNVDCLLAVQRSSYAAATPGLGSAWPEEKALGRDGLAALLDRHRYCVLATSGQMAAHTRRPSRSSFTTVPSGSRPCQG